MRKGLIIDLIQKHKQRRWIPANPTQKISDHCIGQLESSQVRPQLHRLRQLVFTKGLNPPDTT
jgi:hypothetical protein